MLIKARPAKLSLLYILSRLQNFTFIIISVVCSTRCAISVHLFVLYRYRWQAVRCHQSLRAVWLQCHVYRTLSALVACRHLHSSQKCHCFKDKSHRQQNCQRLISSCCLSVCLSLLYCSYVVLLSAVLQLCLLWLFSTLVEKKPLCFTSVLYSSFLFQMVISEVTGRIPFILSHNIRSWCNLILHPQKLVNLYSTEKLPKTSQTGHFGDRVRY